MLERQWYDGHLAINQADISCYKHLVVALFRHTGIMTVIFSLMSQQFSNTRLYRNFPWCNVDESWRCSLVCDWLASVLLWCGLTSAVILTLASFREHLGLICICALWLKAGETSAVSEKGIWKIPFSLLLTLSLPLTINWLCHFPLLLPYLCPYHSLLRQCPYP